MYPRAENPALRRQIRVLIAMSRPEIGFPSSRAIACSAAYNLPQPLSMVSRNQKRHLSGKSDTIGQASDTNRSPLSHGAKDPSTPRVCRYIKWLTIDPGLHRDQWMRWRIAWVLRLQVVVGRTAPVTRMLEVRVRRSDGLRAPSKAMDSLEDRLKTRSPGCSRSEDRNIFSSSLACRARTTWHRGAGSSPAGGRWRPRARARTYAAPLIPQSRMGCRQELARPP